MSRFKLSLPTFRERVGGRGERSEERGERREIANFLGFFSIRGL